MPQFDVVVIGGGAAGMMAAVVVAEAVGRVVVLEKNKEVGAKLAITGGGRCNITNAEFDRRTLLQHYGKAVDYLHSPFSQFGVRDSFAFFEDNGLPLVTEERNRVFPASRKAGDVVRFLENRLRKAGGVVELGCEVTEIVQQNGSIQLLRTNRGEFKATSYILATGGLSRPETGSTGDGFKWLRQFGHKVRQPSPSIVPLAVAESWVRPLAGKAVEARVVFYLEGVRQFKVDGRILLTHFGLSGPAILNSAAKVGDLLQSGKVTASIDLFPTLDHGACDSQLLEVFDRHKNKELKSVLREWLPTGMWQAVGLLLPDLALTTKVHSVSKEQRRQLIQLVKGLPLTVTNLLGFDKAVVADGGVDLQEIDMKTMRSTKVSNLFIVGDLLDINRPSGGYSLQLCWTTGFVAGKNASGYMAQS